MNPPFPRWLPIVALCVVATLGYLGIHWLLQPKVDPSTEPPVRAVNIAPGTNFQDVATELEEKGIVKSGSGFILLAKLTSADRRIRPGEYAFHAGMPPLDILSLLEEGKVALHHVTIPEGFTVRQVAARLEAKGLVDGQELLRLTRDPAFIHSLKLDVSSLEGYLFPTTYRFVKDSKPEDILRTMVAFTWKAFTPELRERAGTMGMSEHEVLTLASVIEKETGAPSERALISAVFHNRLRRNIPLQSDPTVIYALEAFDGNLRKRDLSVKSPYNTYRVRGLPPGPIANPGAAAIRAALHPAKARYLYFVSRNNGTHHFSSTLAEHNRAVNKYQKYRRRVSRRVS